jgi:hypothetical protein
MASINPYASPRSIIEDRQPTVYLNWDRLPLRKVRKLCKSVPEFMLCSIKAKLGYSLGCSPYPLDYRDKGRSLAADTVHPILLAEVNRLNSVAPEEQFQFIAGWGNGNASSVEHQEAYLLSGDRLVGMLLAWWHGMASTIGCSCTTLLHDDRFAITQRIEDVLEDPPNWEASICTELLPEKFVQQHRRNFLGAQIQPMQAEHVVPIVRRLRQELIEHNMAKGILVGSP